VIVRYYFHRLPPDWWPARAKEQAKIEFDAYSSHNTNPMSFDEWKANRWNPQLAMYKKVFRRFGFLFAAYKNDYWWFESLVTVYKLCMTTLIMFVSENDEEKILFGMLGCTIMLGILAFCQPYKHADILSINAVGQLVVLLVLFSAQFLILNNGASDWFAALLIMVTLTPLAAGVRTTLRLPEEALTVEADNFLLQDLSKALPSFLQSSKSVSKAGEASESPKTLLESFKAALPSLPKRSRRRETWSIRIPGKGERGAAVRQESGTNWVEVEDAPAVVNGNASGGARFFGGGQAPVAAKQRAKVARMDTMTREHVKRLYAAECAKPPALPSVVEGTERPHLAWEQLDMGIAPAGGSWEALHDENGDTYAYYNAETGGAWEALHDENGDTYYHNIETGETTWDSPWAPEVVGGYNATFNPAFNPSGKREKRISLKPSDPVSHHV